MNKNIIGSDNSSSPARYRAIIETNQTMILKSRLQNSDHFTSLAL